MEPQRWYSLRELSERTGLSIKQLRCAIDRGELQTHQLVAGGPLYVVGEDWEAYRAQCMGRRHRRRAEAAVPAAPRNRQRRRDLSGFRP